MRRPRTVSQQTMIEVWTVLAEAQSVELYGRNLKLEAEVRRLTKIIDSRHSPVRFSTETLRAFLCLLVHRQTTKAPVPVVKQVVLTPNRYERRLVTLCKDLAAVVNRTYVEGGDEAPRPENIMLMIIRDLLVDSDETLLEGNRARRTSPSAGAARRQAPGK